MVQKNQIVDNTSKLSLSFFSQSAAKSAKQQDTHPTSFGRILRKKKNLGFKVDNSN